MGFKPEVRAPQPVPLSFHEPAPRNGRGTELLCCPQSTDIQLEKNLVGRLEDQDIDIAFRVSTVQNDLDTHKHDPTNRNIKLRNCLDFPKMT